MRTVIKKFVYPCSSLSNMLYVLISNLSSPSSFSGHGKNESCLDDNAFDDGI